MQHQRPATANWKKQPKFHFKSPALTRGFLGGSDGKESTCNVGDLGLIPGLGRSLGEEMATHSSILAWRIPWTEEPGGLQSMGSQRVRPRLIDFHLQGKIDRKQNLFRCTPAEAPVSLFPSAHPWTLCPTSGLRGPIPSSYLPAPLVLWLCVCPG